MTTRRRLASVAVGCAVAAFLLSAAAAAEYRHRIVVLEPPTGEDADHELITRLRAELAAAGFEVIVLPAGATQDPRTAVESAGRALHPASVLRVVRQVPKAHGNKPPSETELWLADRLLRKTFVLRLKAEAAGPSGEAARIAVQAVELVKARLAELAVTRERERDGPPAPPAPPAPRSQRGAAPNLAVAVGLLQSVQRGQQALTPVARLGVALPERLTGETLAIDLRGSFLGLGQAAHVRRAPGSASLRHTLASVDAVMRFLPKGRAQPFLSLGGGALAVDVAGVAPEPYRTASARTWSGVVTTGAGAWLQPLPGLGLSLEAQLVNAWSKTIVRIRGVEVAEVAAPLLVLSAGLMVGF